VSVRVRIHRRHFDSLRASLARPEEVVFAFARYANRVFDVAALELVTAVEVESRTAHHVVLADEVRPRLVKTPWDRDQCLVEAHSHGPRGLAEFSASDLLGFREWVPHVRWRLRGRPYAALVAAGDAWDGLAWVDGGGPVTVEAIEITDEKAVIDTVSISNATAARLAAGGSHDGRSQ